MLPVACPDVAGAHRATVAEPRGLFGWIGVAVLRWPWVVIGFWVALAAVLSVTFPPLTEMASKRPVAILPSDAPVLVTTRQISEAFHQSGSENENVLLVVLTDENGLSPSDLTTYHKLADNLRPDTRRSRHRRAQLVSWRDRKTHSATRRERVGARP